jgi:hypothetical protein
MDRAVPLTITEKAVAAGIMLAKDKLNEISSIEGVAFSTEELI